MNSDSFYSMGSIGWLLVAGGVSLILIVAWCSIVFLLKITKRRLRFDSSKQTKERERYMSHNPNNKRGYVHS